MIDNVKALQLTRGRGLPPVPAGYRAHLHESQHAEVNASCTKVSTQGASPKKLHEVSAMTAHIVDLLRTSPALQDVQYVVDIGAGQVNISRRRWLHFSDERTTRVIFRGIYGRLVCTY